MRANACKGGGGVMALRAHAFWPLKGLYMPRKMVNFGKDGKVYAKNSYQKLPLIFTFSHSSEQQCFETCQFGHGVWVSFEMI